MTDKREINPFLKSALDFGPILVFFVAYLMLKDRVFTIGGTDYDGFIVVTAAFIPLLIASTGALWYLTGQLSRMQVATLVLVVIFGGLSVWLNDDRFFKMKPTMIYLLFGGLLGFGLLRGTSYLKYVMEGMMPLQDAGWMILTKRLMLFFFGLAVLNEVIWRTQSTETWVYFKTFGLSIAVFAFFLSQGKLFQTYGTEEAKDDTKPD
ncbi:inner membrane-spanning protein YciB [Pseudosulfitobacter pseudonitzschiae]|uniref:inner membrane-spanning protein YciB n=1 Tax=Pseudosulfitobacter pseudonitzschiae TaxID=1402135 RepID=UPI001CCD1BEC|nr:inner membrane-spanning protein YciB [Pseudosulfitobacter pseudonitzschiae]MCA0134261.1 septation protein IspZ [Pseudosulfitobacter pseudonitzschiae]MCD2326109.1 septation protein IspZ [Pseudosulfitobacter pseudonitzschiae]MCD2350271.1 septation protein IspZ [Pseudosulfitobacter pseudonitzschiae]MCI2216114.1 septation protein IspZ [Pseudosulfitobacter pseudonitzschiae]UFE28688.1 septation protein IspZ [Pseudosulfitobacter pseudonitzschiae]